MLDNKRIEEAEKNIRNYFDEDLLKKIGKADENIFNVFRRNAEDSLKIADFLHKNNMSSLWTIVCSYYSMYYMANAVLYRMGYKVGDKIPHKVTSDALIVFVRNKLKESMLEEFEEARYEALELANVKADEIIESFDFERVKRSSFQYEMTEAIKNSKAATSLERAKKFNFEIEKMLTK
ncbi:MAG: hypothetical protein V1678_02685 [Candidatus Aenigmatarchaeota archaeon]